MPAPTQCDEFLDAVRESGILEEKRLESFLEQRSAASSLPEDPRDLADEMLQAGLITAFQKDLLLQGKRRGFILADKYILLGHLGAGGMGSVYLCEHKVMRRRVALKVLPPTFAKDPEYLDRFHREARAAAALDHPNIVRAHDAGSDGKMHFLVMEYIEGASMHEIVGKEGALDIQRAADYICQAATGLQHAHESGLVHRDIKPGNLLVDRKGVVKILDMGLALFFQERESLTKQYDAFAVLGTADFLAPEQAIDSHAVDIRADIYSLGLTFFFLLTGKNIYGEGTVAQKLLWHQMREVKSIREFRPEVPEGLAAVISKMIAKDRADRFQTPQELVEALTPWLRPKPGSVPTLPSFETVSQAAAPTENNGEELTLQIPAIDEAPAPSSDKKAATPSAIRTAKTVRVDKPAPGSKRRPTKVIKATVDDSAPTVNIRGPRTPGRPRRKQTGFWSQERLAVAGVLFGLVLILGVVAAIWVSRRGGARNAGPEANATDGSSGGAVVANITPPSAGKDQVAKKKSEPDPAEKTEPKDKPAAPSKAPEQAKTPATKDGGAPAKGTPSAQPKQNPPPTVKKEPRSLADYVPKGQQESVFYDVGDYRSRVPTVYRMKWDFKDDGTIDSTAFRRGTVSKPLHQGGTPTLLTPMQKFEKFAYRIHDGYVEFGTIVTMKNVTTTSWERVLPISAAEGDTWQYRRPGGEVVKCTLMEFKQYNNRPAVVVKDSVPLPPDQEVVTYRTFAQRMGEVARTCNIEKNGKVIALLGDGKLVDE